MIERDMEDLIAQASSTLFVAPGGKTLLVDSGKNGMGRRIQAVMADAGVSQIDFFVDTHYHEDHYGGIDDLVDLGVHVLETYDRGDKEFLTAKKLKEPAYKSYLAAVGEDAHHITRGQTIPLDPLMTVTCISSGGTVIGEDNPHPGNDENDISVSLLITFGDFKYFIGGDIEAPTEQKIADMDLVKDVDVYVADHHGSDTSSILPFIQDLSPRVIVVSNGNNGTYHHPRQSTVSSFVTQLPGPPTVFQTNKCLQGPPCGNVANAFIADPETSDEDGTISMLVDGTAKNYIVSFKSGTKGTFQFKNNSGAGGGGGTTTGGIVIESLLPNPAGDDGQLEAVTLKNKGIMSVLLTGWTLQDRSGLVWQLSGSIAPGQSKTFQRNGMPMTLNNNGDEITLFEAGHAERDRFSYTSSTEGMRIQTNH